MSTTITGLPNATTPLSGTERVPMDQSGTTKDATTQDIANLATKATVGLGNVDNTSDANKPISTATAAALANKAASGAIGSSGLTMATARLLGRTTAGTGAPEEISIGAGLSLSGGALTATGGGGGTVTSVTGTAPIAVATGTTTPVVSISAATTSAAGSMSAADKTKIDSITVDSATVVRKYVRNTSGVSIPKGAAVYQTGSSGTALTVALADASVEATASQTLGLAQEAIAHNANGYVVAVGLLDGVNTSTLTEGQIVWLSETAGEGTTTRPTQPAHGVVLGYCVKQGSGSSGILYVKVDNGLELYELHDVLISGAATDQALVRASDGLWKNRTVYSSSTPAALGTAAVGVGSTLARADHVHAMPSAADVGAATSGHVHGNITNAGAIGSTSGLPVRTGTSGVLEAGSFGTTSGTFAQGNDARFHDGVTLGASVADVLDLSGQVLAADDPGADRILFWDDSEGKLRHLSLGGGLSISGTVLTAPVEIGLACSDETTALATGTAKVTFRLPYAMTLTAVRASVTTAPTGSTLVVDVNEGGTSVLSTKLSIDATEKTSTTAATAAVISDSALADDAEITVDIDQIGATIAGAGLKLWLIGVRA